MRDLGQLLAGQVTARPQRRPPAFCRFGLCRGFRRSGHMLARGGGWFMLLPGFCQQSQRETLE